ncbi:MAG TPA: YbdK family carboxylate-amine ligase [Thermoleophilaceae bacterium]|nr:YbdK family carboxylate-amine ligase [Thermoleophilaceae bacterium]
MSALPGWAEWQPGSEYTLGVEEEVMLLNPGDWSLAQQIDRVLPTLSEDLAAHVTPETHRSALEMGTGIHPTVASAAEELLHLRRTLEAELEPLGLRCASAGTHPFTVWHETVLSSGDRYDTVYDSMRELARREPTFALHVHVGVPDPEAAIRLFNRLRAHLPLLLALSANSPFWQGRDSGLSSARTSLFQAFPRVGVPRAFADYGDWVDTVGLLVRSDAFPDASYLWWDVRPVPRFGTVEVRVMDAQTTVTETAALVALVQCIARLEATDGFASPLLVQSTELVSENRFIAARDGMAGSMIDPVSESRVPVTTVLEELLEACAPHARELGCEAELEPLSWMAQADGARRQLNLARRAEKLPGLVGRLADSFTEERPAGPDQESSLAPGPPG